MRDKHPNQCYKVTALYYFLVVEELEHDIFDAIETEQEEKTAAMLTHMPVRDRWDSKMSWRAEVSVSG